MDVIKTEKKGKHLNTLEKYHVYKISKDRLKMSYTYISTYNPIFETPDQIAHTHPVPYIKHNQFRNTLITSKLHSR
jgi:hypothetical protein